MVERTHDITRTPQRFWAEHREGTRNWLALGLLLAAWNAADDGTSPTPRPSSLRSYPSVSVRAVQRCTTSRS